MQKNAFIFVLFLLVFSSAKAQYLGRNGDGYAMGQTNNVVLGTDEIAINNSAVNIYPNPSKLTGGFMLNFGSPAQWSYIEIYDVTGQLKYKTIAGSSGNLRINLSENEVKSGVYFLVFRSSKGRSTHHKIVLTD